MLSHQTDSLKGKTLMTDILPSLIPKLHGAKAWE